MRSLTKASILPAALGTTLLWTICSCGPTDLANTAPSITAIADRTVFVGEPIDLSVDAGDPDGDAITYSLSGISSGASIDASTGRFSWRPAIADTGEQTITFQASDGANQVTTAAKFTIVMPSLDESEAIRFLRPLADETYYYGDTLTIAFAIKWCAVNAFVEVHTSDQHTSAQAIDMPERGGTDSMDTQQRECRFARLFEDRMMWIGYYKFPLVNQVLSTGDTLDLGGGTARADSIRINVRDAYVDQRGPVGCASTTTAGVPVMFALIAGEYSERFSVLPRP